MRMIRPVQRIMLIRKPLQLSGAIRFACQFRLFNKTLAGVFFIMRQRGAGNDMVFERLAGFLLGRLSRTFQYAQNLLLAAGISNAELIFR